MSTNPIKITTVDRILDASLKLFNEQGFHCVPAMRIAEHLGISPGHLAYHFKNKSDILLALFPRLETALEQIMQLECAHATPQSMDRTLYVLKTLWNYRFFFIELPQIAPVDRQILDSYLKLEDRFLGMLEQSFNHRIAEGAMRPIPAPNSTRFLAKSVWITWLDWIRSEQMSHPGQTMPSAESVYETMLRAYCMSMPFFDDELMTMVTGALQKRLGLNLTGNIAEPASPAATKKPVAKVRKPRAG